MSDLKWQTVEQLQQSKLNCENYIQKLDEQISKLHSQKHGQEVRLEWIAKYLFEKTPQELSFDEVERILGHKLILKE